MTDESGYADKLIKRLERQLEVARRDRRDEKKRVRELRAQLEKLRLVALATHELLMERATVSDEELHAKIEEVDARDGIVDGRLRELGEPPRCTRCERALIKSAPYCLYCGPPDESERGDRL